MPSFRTSKAAEDPCVTVKSATCNMVGESVLFLKWLEDGIESRKMLKLAISMRDWGELLMRLERIEDLFYTQRIASTTELEVNRSS